jgi:glycerol-3-phosphate acyltransferase PlsY
VTVALAALLLVLGFLSGSIPVGYFIGRARGLDIRAHGSGNIGATNVGRVLGKRLGLLSFFLDMLKGLVPSLLAGMVLSGRIDSPLREALTANQATALWLSVAVAAVLGHMFTPWLGFKGGKGISTGLGALAGVYPVFTLAAVVALVTWIIALKVTRMVGISSVIASAALALFVLMSHVAPDGLDGVLHAIPLYQRATPVHVGFALALLLLIIYKHRGNIARTIAGTEPKVGRKVSAPPP